MLHKKPFIFAENATEEGLFFATSILVQDSAWMRRRCTEQCHYTPQIIEAGTVKRNYLFQARIIKDCRQMCWFYTRLFKGSGYSIARKTRWCAIDFFYFQVSPPLMLATKNCTNCFKFSCAAFLHKVFQSTAQSIYQFFHHNCMNTTYQTMFSNEIICSYTQQTKMTW